MPNSIRKPIHGSDEWLWLRHRDENGSPVITASDAAAVHGQHPYKTKFAFFHEKLADIPARSEQNEAMERGNRLEPVIRDWAADRLGIELVEPEFMYWTGSSDLPLMVTPDAIDFEHRNDWVSSPDLYLEIKTSNKIWTGVLPPLWYWQGVHAAICADMEIITWAIFDSTLSLHIHEQKVTVEEKEAHRLAVMDFVWWLRAGEPNPEWPMTYDDVSQANPHVTGGTVDVSDQAELFHLYREVIAEKRRLEDQEDELKARIAALIGSNVEAVVNGTTVATWKSQTRSSLDTKHLKTAHPDVYAKFEKQSTYRVLRIKGEKE